MMMSHRWIWIEGQAARWSSMALAGAAFLLLACPGMRAQDVVALRNATVETVGPAGRLELATIVLENGRIHSIGVDIPIPDRAQVIDLAGKTVLPGFVDPYFVVEFPVGGEADEEPRTVSVRGRNIQVPQAAGSPAAFVRIADVFDARRGDWNTAVRSGITTAHVVSRGYGQSVFVNPLPSVQLETMVSTRGGETPHPMIVDASGRLFTAVTNNSTSLRTVREGLAEPRPAGQGGGRRGGSGGQREGAGAEGTGGGRPSTEGGPAREGGASAGSGDSPASSNPAQELWRGVRIGERPVFINANNAAAILYVLGELEKTPTASCAAVASGSDWYLSLPTLKDRKVTAILPPRLDTEPRNQTRVNVPRLLHEAGIDFAFSLSTGQSEYRSTQPNPLFPVTILIKSGLPREVALEALTIRPARLMGIADQVGSLEPGKRADLVVFDSDPLGATAEVVQVWSGGRLIYGE